MGICSKTHPNSPTFGFQCYWHGIIIQLPKPWFFKSAFLLQSFTELYMALLLNLCTLFFCFKAKVFEVAATAAASGPSSLPQFHFPTTTTKNFYNYRMWIVKPGDEHLKHTYTETQKKKKKPQLLWKSRIISHEMLWCDLSPNHIKVKFYLQEIYSSLHGWFLQ